MGEAIADWVFESVLQFIKSPMWSAPVLGFIEEHCSAFEPGEAENKLEYTAIHKAFCALVDGLLSGFLADLGVQDEDFVDAIKCGRCPELSELVTEYLLSMEDFVAFRAMMERHNHELELEAMYEHARVVEGARGALEADADEGSDEMDEEERFLLEMAIQASLRPADVRLKEAELEDAELLQALAMSMAIEQERRVREQLGTGEDEAKQQAAQAEAEENQRAINDAFLKQREDNAARSAAAEAEADAAAATSATSARGTATPPAAPVAPPVAHVSPAKVNVATRVLAPVGDRRGIAPAFGARGAPLGAIGTAAAVPSSAPAPPVPSAPQPSFNELRAQHGASASGAAAGPSEAEMQQRATYLKAQREALLKVKKAERDAAVAKFQQEKGVEPAVPPAAAVPAAAAGPDAKKAVAEADMRRMIAMRLKEDVLSEARKAAAAA